MMDISEYSSGERPIGERGYRPRWAGSRGRWAQQRVPAQIGKPGGLMHHFVSWLGQRGPVWIRGRILGLFTRRDERPEAASELAQIPFVCLNCGWEGWGDDLDGSRDSRDPNLWDLYCPRCEWQEFKYCRCTECDWRGWIGEEEILNDLMEKSIRDDLNHEEEALLDAFLDENDTEASPVNCPECGQRTMQRTGDEELGRSKPGPDLQALNFKKVLSRWQALGRPKLEHPNYHPMAKTKHITDLESFAEKLELMPNELTYLAQQMWPSLPETLASISDTPRQWPAHERHHTRWGQELRAWVPPLRAIVWSVAVLVVIGLIAWYGVAQRRQKDHFDSELAIAFGSWTYDQETGYRSKAWYRPGSWDGPTAAEQLVFRIEGRSLSYEYAAALRDALPAAKAEPRKPDGWFIEFPALPSVSVGSTKWIIYENGGYEYTNAQADKLLHCAGADFYCDNFDKCYRYTKNERDWPCSN